METIHKNQLLDCFKQSNSANQLFNDSESVSIPKQYVITEIKIQTDTDLRKILNVLRY